MPKAEKILLKLRTSDLCELFNCTPRTLRRWRRLNRLNTSDLADIIDKYLNRYKLDKRITPQGGE